MRCIAAAAVAMSLRCLRMRDIAGLAPCCEDDGLITARCHCVQNMSVLSSAAASCPPLCTLQTKVQNALKNLEEYATFMRVLGSYPISK